MKGTLLNIMVLGLTFLVAAAFVAGRVSATGGEEVGITGKVLEGKIVADDGKEYAIADNAQAKELMSGHMCHQVEVKGTVATEDGEDTITISSFKHLAEGKC